MFDMDALSALESQIEQLLVRLETLRTENSRLGVELAQAARENIHLATQNRALRDSLDREAAIRVAALQKLRSLLKSVQDYRAAG